MPGSTSRPLATKGGDGTSHLGNMATIGQDLSSILLDVACQLILGPMYDTWVLSPRQIEKNTHHFFKAKIHFKATFTY